MPERAMTTIQNCLERNSLNEFPKLLRRDYKKSGNYPVIDQGQSLIGGWTDDGSGLISKNLPVITFGDHTRTLKYIDFPFVRGADGTQVLKPKVGIEPLYFYYACRAINLPSRGYSRHFKAFKEKKIPLPPLSKQKRIVADLNKKMAAAEKARKAALERIGAIQDLPAAFLREIFSFGDSKLPQGWRWTKLGEVANIFSGSSAPQGSEFFSTSGFPFVRVSDLSEQGAGGIIYKTRDRLSDIAISDCSLKKAPKGAVVLPKSGAAIATNRRALLGIDAYIVSHLLALVAIPALSLKEWIYFALRQIDMMDYSDNTGYPSLKKSVVEEIEIPLPPLSEQKRIVADLDKKMAAVEKARNAAEAESETINALPAAFLREAFGGTL